MVKRGFTLIELLLIVAIIAILATIILVNLASPKDDASVAAYKTTLQSVRAAMEMCAGTGGAITSGTRSPGDAICDTGTMVYPDLPRGCDATTFDVLVGSGDDNWSLSTTDGVYCGGCRLVCNVDGCVVGAEETTGDCRL